MPDTSSPADLPPDAPAPGDPSRREDLLRVFLAQRERMEALVSRRVGCRATAADLVQDLFLRFWRRPAAPVEDLATYLLRSAHNLAIDHMRSEGARTRNEAGLLLEQGEAPPRKRRWRPATTCVTLKRPCARCRSAHARSSCSTASTAAPMATSRAPWGFPSPPWKNI